MTEIMVHRLYHFQNLTITLVRIRQKVRNPTKSGSTILSLIHSSDINLDLNIVQLIIQQITFYYCICRLYICNIDTLILRIRIHLELSCWNWPVQTIDCAMTRQNVVIKKFTKNHKTLGPSQTLFLELLRC